MKNAEVPKEGSTARAVFSFIDKLTSDDTNPSLKIKTLKNAADKRVRTGRVNLNHRAVLVQLRGGDDATYVYLGTWEHDKANSYAASIKLTINPVTGVPELEQLATPVPDGVADVTEQTGEGPALTHAHREAPSSDRAIPASGSQPRYPLLETWGHSVESLMGHGLGEKIARHAMALETEDELVNYAGGLTPSWKGIFLIDIGTGRNAAEALEDLGFTDDPAPVAVDADAPTDEEILRSLEHPAAKLDFALVEPTAEGMAELADVLEGRDFAAWRVFLHPQQRAYANRGRNGAFRLSGGAGTGKTVVLLHRARVLHRKNPDARIVLTTFGRTLSESLADQLSLLDPGIPQVSLGERGVAIVGVDAMVRRMLSQAGTGLYEPGYQGVTPVARVLGEGRSSHVLDVTDTKVWQQVADMTDLPAHLTPQFLEAEYSLVILPARITQEAQYLRIPRPGRGVRLSRGDRRKVWEAVQAYRAHTSADGTTDWHEKAMIAASYLDALVADGMPRPTDHVLVDETQDLSPAHLHFLRALVSEGKNDLFLADDAHQRIYSPKVTLSHYGINIRGRSRRLTLNYRTTARNLSYALSVLDGVEYTDLDGEEVPTHGYRSARTGVVPTLIPCTSQLGEYDAVAEHIRTWGRSGNIGVLCGTMREGEAWVRELTDRGIEAVYVGRDSQADVEGVAVMTRHRAKGMEFSRVAMVGLGRNAKFPGAEEDDAGLRERSLVYVGATRARDELLVSWVGEPHRILRPNT